MKLLKELFVCVEDAGTQDEWLRCDSDLKSLATEEGRTVGRYVLKEKLRAQLVLEVKPAAKS